MFLSNAKALWYWDRSGSAAQIAPASDLGLTATSPVANAAFFDGAFWFVDEIANYATSQTLVKITFSYDSAGKPAFGSRTAYTVNFLDGAGAPVTIPDSFGGWFWGRVGRSGCMGLCVRGGLRGCWCLRRG